MWKFEHTETTTASPSAIWYQWSHPELWPKQNKLLRAAKLDGPFAIGSKIIMTPASGPKTSVTITEVSKNKSFSAEGSLPLGKLVISHEILDSGKKNTEFSHTMTVTGPFTFLFRKLFIDNMAKNLPEMMKNIARFAEES